MSEKDVTYEHVTLDGFDEVAFSSAKTEGALCSGLSTVRKSPDGKTALIPWQGTRPVEIAKRSLWSGTTEEARAYALKLWGDFERDHYALRAAPGVKPLSTGAMLRADIVDPPKEPGRWKKWAAWTAGAAAAAGAAWAAAHFAFSTTP